jgi:GTP-binding protein HflX
MSYDNERTLNIENLKDNSAVLVGIQLPQMSSSELESSLNELERLVTTLGYKVVGRVTQKRSTDRSLSVLGDGKLAELAAWTDGSGKISHFVERKKSKAALKRELEEETSLDSDDNKTVDSVDFRDEDQDEGPLDSTNLVAHVDKKSAQVVVVDSEMSPSQLRNLESATGVKVLDRTGVIIEIFSRHARTRASRLQVEIARLTYVAPRLRETGGGEDRGGGGIGGKGSGETSLELDKRKIRDRIKELKTELASIGNEHLQRRARREQELSVALVGYTNAGKSSLMRAMTGSEVLVADKLFATLDTTVRPIYPETRPKILLSDTVGFIKKLPHDLVASFKSTLDEALHASLLLFVVDASDPAFRSQLTVTQNVLSEVGATEVPRLLVLNKQDCLTEEQKQQLHQEFPDGIFISTRNVEDVKKMREKILSYFESDMQDESLFIPYTAKGVIGDIRLKMRVLSESYDEKGVTLTVRSSSERLDQIKRKILSAK